MANEKVSQMTALTAAELATADLFLITDVSAKESKKIAVGDVLTYIEATGSFHTTNADSASYVPGSGVDGSVASSSYASLALTSSYAIRAGLANTASNALTASVTLTCVTSTTTADTASFLLYQGFPNGTASFALTASKAVLSDTSSFLLYSSGINNGTASYSLTSSFTISSSIATTASYAITSSYSVTSSLAVNSLTASFIPGTTYGVPAGTVITYAANTAPAGWLECDGTAVSRTAYGVLYTAIGTTWGAGDGSTTFNLPDLRGYFVRGWDHGRGVDTGRAFASVENDAIKDHSHGGGTQYEALVQRGSADTLVFAPVNHGEGTTAMQSTSTVNAPNNGGTETRPKNISLMYCIKT